MLMLMLIRAAVGMQKRDAPRMLRHSTRDASVPLARYAARGMFFFFFFSLTCHGFSRCLCLLRSAHAVAIASRCFAAPSLRRLFVYVQR